MAHHRFNALAAALGLAFAGQLPVPAHASPDSGFALVPLERGYLLSEHGEEEGSETKGEKGEEGKCGEGKCGEGKCGSA